MYEYTIDKTRCTGCKSCFSICPRHAVVMVDDKAFIEPGLCDRCGLCLSSCAQGAIVKVASAVTPQEKIKPPIVKIKSPLAEKMTSPLASTLLTGAATILTRVVKNIINDWIQGGAINRSSQSLQDRSGGAGAGRRQRLRRRGA